MNNDKYIDYDYSDIDDGTLEDLAALILGIGKYRKDAVQPIHVAPEVEEITEEEIQPAILETVTSVLPIEENNHEQDFELNGTKAESASQAQHRYKFVKRKIIKNEKPVKEKKPVKNYKWIPQVAYFYLREEKIGHKLKLLLNNNPSDDIGETVLTRNVIDTFNFDEINKSALIKNPEFIKKEVSKTSQSKVTSAKKSQTSTSKSAVKKTFSNGSQKKTTASTNAKQQAKADIDEIVKKAQKNK